MSLPARRSVRALLVVSVATLGLLGGCRRADRAALPASEPRTTPVVTAPVMTGAGATGAGASGYGATGYGSDPLAAIESTVDAVERDVDGDARADVASGR